MIRRISRGPVYSSVEERVERSMFSGPARLTAEGQ